MWSATLSIGFFAFEKIKRPEFPRCPRFSRLPRGAGQRRALKQAVDPSSSHPSGLAAKVPDGAGPAPNAHRLGGRGSVPGAALASHPSTPARFARKHGAANMGPQTWGRKHGAANMGPQTWGRAQGPSGIPEEEAALLFWAGVVVTGVLGFK